eukprot:jgi/Hompol1/2316/HPOL_002201-RA
MLQLLLWNPSPDPKEPNFAFRESMLAGLVALLKQGNYQVTLITLVRSDEEEAQVRALLTASGLLQTPAQHHSPVSIDPRRVLFCETQEGVAHMVRHIAPDVHVDVVASRVKTLAQWIPNVVFMRKRSPTPPSQTPLTILHRRPSTMDMNQHTTSSRSPNSFESEATHILSQLPVAAESASTTDSQTVDFTGFSNIFVIEDLAEL